MASGVSIRIDVRCKMFGAEEPIFDALTLDVQPSEVVAIIGASGVGKSTLLRMVSGIDTDFSGEIIVDGQAAGLGGVPGFVFQDPRLLPWTTAAGNLKVVNPDATDAAIRSLFESLGIAGSENAYPHELSGGMQRRVALARALIVQSGLLLLDEPFVSIDRKLARELHGLLCDVFDTYSPTALLVTHDAEDAARLADRVIRLQGRPAQITEKMTLGIPRQDRTAAYVSDVTNRLAGDPQ